MSDWGSNDPFGGESSDNLGGSPGGSVGGPGSSDYSGPDGSGGAGGDDNSPGTQALLDAVNRGLNDSNWIGTERNYIPVEPMDRDRFDRGEEHFENVWGVGNVTTVMEAVDKFNAEKLNAFNYRVGQFPDPLNPGKMREYPERTLDINPWGAIAGLLTANPIVGGVVAQFTPDKTISAGAVGYKNYEDDTLSFEHGIKQSERPDDNNDDRGEDDAVKRIFQTASQRKQAVAEAEDTASDEMFEDIKSQLPMPTRERKTTVHAAHQGLQNPLSVLFKMLDIDKVV